MLCAGKVVRLRQKLSDITGAVTGIFGRKSEKDPAVARLDALKVLPVTNYLGDTTPMRSVQLAHPRQPKLLPVYLARADLLANCFSKQHHVMSMHAL